jgi:hypothetical protein
MEMRKCKTLFAVMIVALCGLLCSGVFAAQPHLQRSGTNLILNPNVNGFANWSGNFFYDTLSRDGGTGSLKMTIPYPDTDYSYINSSLAAVTPGNVYTMAFYMCTNAWPPPVITTYVAYYNSSQQFIRNDILGGLQGVTAQNSWQEVVSQFRPRSGEAYARIVINIMSLVGGSGAVWIDNAYMGQGIGFEQAPTAKAPFNGTQTKVDELGNVEIYKDGVWTPFFPICIYADGNRDWSFYSDQGFNTVMWTWDYLGIRRARQATSAFNPDGMMANFEVTGYLLPGASNYNNLTDLTNKLQAIIDNGQMDNMLFYYWDNEAYYGWSVPVAVTDIVKTKDTVSGSRMHPIYALQGMEGLARKYNSTLASMSDITGTYVTSDQLLAAPENYPDDFRGVFPFIMLSNVEKQQMPVVIAQLNTEVGIRFRPRLYAAIAKGAKGLGFFRDWYNTTDPTLMPEIEDQPWWNDLPNIRNEIDQLLPVIRMPHWTSWSLSSSNSYVEFGTRDYDRKGHVIISNEQSSSQSVTFTISGLPYAATAVRNFFTNEIEGKISNSQFTVSIPAYGSKVYVLESNIEKMLALKLLCNETSGTAYDSSYFANNGTLLNGAAFSGGAVSLDGANDRVYCGNASSLDIGTQDVTLVARVKLNASQGTYAGIVTKGGGGDTDAGYALFYQAASGVMTFTLSNGTTNPARLWISSQTGLNLHDDAWHTVGVTVNRGGNVIFYVGGIAKGSGSISSMSSYNIINANRNLLVGSWLDTYHIRGLVDNVRIYKKNLTAQEMADLSGNILLDMQFNETSGNPFDSGSYSNNGTLCGNAVVGGGTVSLDGSGDYVNCGRAASLDVGTSDFTITAKVKLDSAQGAYVGIAAKGAGSPTNAGYAFFYTTSSGKLRLSLSNGTSSAWLDSNQNLGLNDGLWHTVGVTVARAGNAVFYVDGIQKGSASASSFSGSSLNSSNEDLKLGAWITGNFMKGQIDCAKLYKRALTSTEMATP